MKTQLVLSCLFGLVLCACSPTMDSKHNTNALTEEQVKENLLTAIDSLQQIHKLKGAKDPYTVTKLITAYTEYRNKFANDENTPQYLRSAGDLAMSIGKMELAADLYKNFFNSFKSHPYRDDALFMLGYIYDLELKNKDLAKQTYEHYFKLYGDSVHIDQVRARLTDLNLSEEELIEKFRKQNNLD